MDYFKFFNPFEPAQIIYGRLLRFEKSIDKDYDEKKDDNNALGHYYIDLALINDNMAKGEKGWTSSIQNVSCNWRKMTEKVFKANEFYFNNFCSFPKYCNDNLLGTFYKNGTVNYFFDHQVGNPFPKTDDYDCSVNRYITNAELMIEERTNQIRNKLTNMNCF